MWDNYHALRALGSKLLFVALAMLLYSGGYWLVHSSLFPLRKVYVTGELDKVTPAQLDYLAKHELHGTFFTLNLDNTRAAFQKLAWVSQAEVKRRWPDSLEVALTEHQAIARWGEQGLIDNNGEWFDAESDEQLTTLTGPEHSEKNMAEMLPKIRQWLAPSGLSPLQIVLLKRGAWRVQLSNKAWLELGRGEEAQVEHRARSFAAYWQDIKANMPNGVSYVDMRYPNGFAVQAVSLQAKAIKHHQK